MKVCHVIHDLRRGGAEHLLVDLAGEASDAGIDMSVVSLMPATGHGYADALRRAGIEVHSLELASRWDPRAPGRLTRLLGGLRPDLVHSHLKHADLVVSKAAPRLEIPWISSLHVVEDAVGIIGRMKRRLALRARDRSAAMIVAVSGALRDWYLSLSQRDPETVVVLHNGVPAPPAFPPGHREETRRALGVPDGAVMAATVVILRPGKGIDDLLEAAAALPDGSPAFFVIAGSGPEEQVLRDRADQLGLLGTRVALPGFVEDVAGLLASADLLVHPSHADALATALIHGMAASLPVVATDVGGTCEIVDPAHGLVVPPGRPDELGLAIEALVADPALRDRMGAAAAERFHTRFDIAVWTARLVEIYREVLTRAG